MFLKELELVGFKSFPEKTRLKFEPGITAIVGPNGCGKSNIFDGIRWVLGEQSTKALRSLKMEDVIFSGTDNKTSLGMAEVTVVFSNKSRKLVLDSDEIEISRRIFRSGESQYLLNKVPVRLKDILDLLMGTGIGAESYSLIEQGKIDLILSNRPEERRLIFDEASGITKYKMQKREALRKLEETEQNLLRINDIITEVRREINSLERQANKARRYKEAFGELKGKESNLATLEIIEVEKQKQDLLRKINTFQENVNSHETKALEVQEEISLRFSRIQQLEKGVLDYHDQLININNLINNNNRHIEINKERTAEFDSRIVELKEQLKDAKGRIETTKKNLENFQKEYNEAKERIKEKQVLLSSKQKEYEETNSSIRSSQEKVKDAKNKILDLAAISSQIKNDVTDLQAHLKSQILRKKRLDIEKIKTKEERESLSRILSNQIREINIIKSEFKRIDDERKQINGELDSEVNIQERLIQGIKNLENEEIALVSQKEFLQKLRLKYEGISQSLNAVLYLDRLPADNISGIIVKIKEPPLAVKKRLDTHPPSLKFKLSGEAKPIPLETKTITERIEHIKSEVEQKQEKLRLVQNRIKELKETLQNLDQRAKDQEMLISNKSVQVENLTEQLNRINQEFEVVDLELKDLEGQIEQLNNKQTQLQVRLVETDEQQKKQDAAINSLENSIAELRSLRERILVDITQIKTDIDNHNVRLTQQEKTQVFLENANQQSQQLYQRYLDEIQQSELKIKQLLDDSLTLKQQSQKAQQDMGRLNKEQSKQQVELQQLSRIQEQNNNKIASLNQDIEGLRKEIYEHQIQAKDFDFKQRSIRDRISQVYKVVLEDSSGTLNHQDKEILIAQIHKLKQRLDSLGTVNLIAIEEYDELKKRYDFLIQQQNDLNQAKHSLNNAINKISRTTRQMFLETFGKIQVEFRSYFRLLFGGGEGRVILTDEADPLESGIEIICRPPGKKLQNVLALSGGEKALAAVSLMFAILKVNPSPFCVFDEIDAALDEANISRFSGILQEFARDSQFLVITHNKRTITNADAMYGITMEEPGTSKIVSVKFS